MTRYRIGVSGAVLAGLGLLLAILIAGLAVAGKMLIDFERGHHERVNQALVESLRSQLQTGYSDLQSELQRLHPVFRGVHAQARREVERHGPESAPIEALASKFRERLGYPVHIYIITPEQRISRSTFTPDEGLDFTQEGFADARQMIKTAQRRDETLVGPPTLEMVSREFRIYSYGPIGDTGYTLELGFSPPRIQGLFSDVATAVSDSDMYSSDLFFLFHDKWLISLKPSTEVASLTKEEAYDRVPKARERQRQLFQRAIDKESVYKPQPDGHVYYAWLQSIELGAGNDLEVLARLRMEQPGVTDIRQSLLIVFGALTAMTLLAALAFQETLRRALIKPLHQATAAIANGDRVALSGPFKRIRELNVLATHINHSHSVTEQRVAGLNELAHTDALTGLPNRMALEEALEHLVSDHRTRGAAFALIVMDLDHFKALNDHYGHACGDQLLERTAHRLRDNVRQEDIVGRWGGEEFVILLPETNVEGALTATDKLRWTLANDSELAAYGLTASFGIATLNHAEDTKDSLFQRADAAMYSAKRAGRDGVAVY